MSAPPAGGVHRTDTEVGPFTATAPMVGASGAVTAVTGVEGGDAEPEPAALAATISNVYEVPAVSPVTVQTVVLLGSSPAHPPDATGEYDPPLAEISTWYVPTGLDAGLATGGQTTWMIWSPATTAAGATGVPGTSIAVIGADGADGAPSAPW